MKNLFKTMLLIIILISHSLTFAAEPQPQKLTVILDWLVNPNHAPLFVAKQEGFFKDQGLDVQFISPAATSSGEKMVAANKADIVITYQPKLMQLVNQRLPLIRFATLINSPLNCFVVLDDGRIQSLKDLKGKRVGVCTQNLDNKPTLSTILHSANLTIKDIEPIYVNFNLISALLTNKIDGFSGGMRNFTPFAIELAGKRAKLFFPEKHGFPEYDELILVTNKNKIHDPVLIKFTHALKKGVIYLKNNPKKSWQKFAIKNPELNDTLNKKTWLLTLKYFANNPTKLDKKKYQTFTNFLWNKGIIKTIPKLEDYAQELR